MKRSNFNMSNYKVLSCDMGELIPIQNQEVLPNDVWQGESTALIRVTPQLKPLMQPVEVRIHHFYYSNRKMWTGWEDHITGKSAGTIPTIAGSAFSAGTLSDYLGAYDDASNTMVAFPVRMYNACYNNFYRDKDIISEVATDTDTIQPVAWGKDYFTTARAELQQGTAVSLPLGTSADVHTAAAAGGNIGIYSDSTADHQLLDADLGAVDVSTTTTNAETNKMYADLSSATSATIAQLRNSLALQKYAEARTIYGDSYVDYLRYLGVRPSDGRLDRPIYLGGGKTTIAFSEILNTTGANTPGAMVGHGIAAVKSNKFRYFCEEHGFIQTYLSVRPKSLYVNGLPRMFSRADKEDYYTHELEGIGAQSILNKELAADHTTPGGTFGYSGRYDEYRSCPSSVAAEMRTSTNYDFHMGRILSDPALNTAFLNCVPTKRAFAEQSAHSLWVFANNHTIAKRAVSKRAWTGV